MPIKFVVFLIISALFVFYHPAAAQQSDSQSSATISSEPPAFYPTWKLLNPTEKAQFLAGYLHGWSDAKNVTNIAIDYIKTNPDKAVNSLEGIGKLYDVSNLKPEELAAAVDAFYEKPQNKAASLSLAVTAAKNSLK